MKKVILWGSRLEYDIYCKFFEVEVLKSNIKIEALVLNEEAMFSFIDGIEVIGVEDLLNRQFDYLINMNRQEPQTVRRILELLKIPLEKVIPAKVFRLPAFDWERYIKVREGKVSIIANHCWGGYTYNSLGMQFLSPFINMFVAPDDYLRLLGRFEYYINAPLHYLREGYEETLKKSYPVAGLEDVELHFNHYPDFETAASIWNKRKDRINRENLLVQMSLDHEETAEKFAALPFSHKIGLSTIASSLPDILYFPVEGNDYLENRYGKNIFNFFNHVAMLPSDEFKCYDILKLLNHESDYVRVKYERSF